MLFVFVSALNSLNIGLKKSFHSLLPGCDIVVLLSAVADSLVNDLDNDTNTVLSLVSDIDTLKIDIRIPRNSLHLTNQSIVINI